jgi:hypothetical protein
MNKRSKPHEPALRTDPKGGQQKRCDSEQDMEFAQVVRSMIDAENKLISDRLGWLLTTQGLLFAGLGVAWKDPTAKPLVFIVNLLGLAVSMTILMCLIGSSRAQARLLKWWADTHSKEYSGPPVIGLEPPGRLAAIFLAPWNWMTLFFLLAWLAILYFRLR